MVAIGNIRLFHPLRKKLEKEAINKYEYEY